MHVVVLGAGVVGITTAYFLTKAGHEVAPATAGVDQTIQVTDESLTNGGGYGKPKGATKEPVIQRV